MRAYIFEKGTENIKCSVEKLEYNGQFMGENSVIVSAKSPKHIDFNIDDYVVFRGENFYLANIPTEKKTGDRNTKGDVFQYDNMKFMSVQYELNNADFNDFVGGSQTDISFTAQPNFSFVAATVTDLAQRIQVNMDRYYTGDKKWTIKVDNNYTTSDDNLNKLITISNITCWGALALFKSLYDTNFIVRGRTVTIGGSGSIKDITFKVGAYKGLWDMTRNSQTDQGIVTKLTSYGNTTNINPRYYSLIGVTVSAKISFASKYSITRSGVNDYIFQFDLSYSSELRTNINVTISGYTFDMVYGSYGEYSGWVISSGVSDRNSIGKSIYDSLAVDSKGTPTVTVSAIINSGARKDNISDLSHLSFDVNSKLPNNMNIMNLMLPAFPTQTLAEWVEENKSKYSWLQEYVNQGYAFSTERFYPCIYSKNKDVLGIRPHTEYFTSEDETHKDIYPSLQYFQDDRNQVVGATTLNGGTISDSGVFADGATVDPIYIIIPDLGFEFDDVYNGTQPKIHLNSGYCGGRDYTVKTWERDSSNNWKLKCDRKDEAVGKWFPYVDAPIKKGDKFVITDIYMPDTYIEQASVELLKWSMKWIAKNDYTVFSYQLTPDISFIKRHDDKITDKGTTFYRTVKEGDILLIEDTDIGVTGSITIDQIKITIGDGLLPKYDITLRDTKTVGTLQKVQQQIDALTGGGSGSGYNSSQIGEVAYAALKDKFLSKTNNDKANGLIGFEKGLETGTFQSGLLGSGAIIDAKGNSEVESIMSRTFMAAKAFLYNLIEVNIGERWSTNGFCKIKSVDTVNQIITEQLDSDEYSTMQLGDICRGIYSNIGNQYTTENKDADDCGFPTKYGFFTSYFSVTKIIESGKGISKFEYQLRTSATPHPCALMQAAQYGSFTDGKRRASIFQSNYPHAYTENLEGVSTWVINSANITKRDGWLGDVEITLKNGTKQQLYGYGLYVQDNVYFGSAVIQLSPQTLADLQKELSNHIVSLTDYASSFTADAKGNIIGGLWFEDDLGNKQYRIHTAVSVTNNNNIMLWLADSTKDATENKYKLYVQGIGCSAFISNSTVYITSIDNFNDGIATTDDGSKHTDEWYDIMRKTNSCSVNIIVDCEGKGSIVKTMNIGIKHTEEVFAIADLDNEMSNIRFSLKDGKYKGFDSSATGVTIKHNNVAMKIKNTVFGTLPSGITAAYTLSTDSLSAVITFASSLTTDTLTDFNVPITVVGRLAGVDYESTLYKKFTKIEGTATYELSPSTGSIGATYDANGNKVLSTDKISCGIKCYDDSGENYDLTSAQQTDRSITLSYVVYDASGNSIKNGNASVGDNISLTSASYKIVFTLIIASKTVDLETIYVNADGKPSFTYIRYATNLNGNDMQTSPDDTHIYIGVYTGILATAPNIASAYTWMRWKGDTGEGTKGDNGYVHIAWCNTSDNSDNSFTISNTDGKEYAYIGTYTDNTASDSTTFSTYTWVKVKGEKGDNAYIHIRYSADNITSSTGASMSDTPSSTDRYIGILSNNTATASTTKSDYVWSLFYGQDGSGYELVYFLSSTYSVPSKNANNKDDVQNKTGYWYDDPQSTTSALPYLWVSQRTNTNGVWGNWGTATLFSVYGKFVKSIVNYYLASASGSGVTKSQITSTSVQTTTVTLKYLWTWQKTTFNDGSSVETDAHIIGTYGDSAYLHIKFAKTNDTTESDMSDTPTSEYKYIGLYTDNNSEASTTKSDYIWSVFFGQDGESYQIIYKLTSSNTAPSAYTGADQPTSTTRGDWTDNPLSCDATSYPYQFESMRTKSNGVWSSWSTPSFYNRYAKDGTDGTDGTDGDNGEYYQKLYQLNVSKPTIPVVDNVTNLPTSTQTQPAWQVPLLVKDNDMDISYTDIVGNWTNGYVAYIKSPVTANSKYSCMRINIVTTKDNATLAMEINVSSEQFDYGVVSNLDDSVSTSPSALSSNSYKAKISGTVNGQMLYFPISKAGTHYIYVYYYKDSSVSSGNDAFWFRCNIPNLYSSSAKATKATTADVYSFGTWSDAIEENSAPSLPVQAKIDKASFKPTAYNLITGAATSDISDTNNIYLYAGSHKCTIDSITSDISANIALSVVDVNTAKIVYSASIGAIISTQTYNITVTGKYNGITYTAKTVYSVLVTLNGDKGEKGDKGNTGSRGFIVYPAGEWNTSTTYTNDGDNAPMVLYSGLYYILNVVTSVKGTNPASDTTNWKAMSMIDYIFTKVLFANFAKLGSAVFSGDYMFSQYGTYNGTAYTDGSYISRFSGNFMTNTATSTEFIPYYCVNLKTGKTYQSNAYIKGKVEATSGSIGGFEIGDGRIGVTPSTTTVNGVTFQTQGNGNLVICKDFFRVGGSNAYVMFGDNVIPSTAGGAFTAAARIYNHTVNTGSSYGLDQANYGLIVDVSGGTKNYAIYSDNAVGRFTSVYGTRMYKLNITSSTYIVDLSQNNVLYIYMSTSYTINLPNQSQLASQFGYSSLPDNFFYMFTIVAAYGTAAMKIADVKNRDWGNVSIDLSQGDVLLIAAIYNGSTFVYKLINEYR